MVVNAKKIVSDAVIGSFRLDLGHIYNEVDHSFIHKWLLLTDPCGYTPGETKV